MRGVSLGVALVAVGLYFVGLGAAPFLDPPEGFHAEAARQMSITRDWVTPRVNGVRYFDKPPLLYWLVSASFGAAGVTPFAARLWPALAAVACAAATARLGALLGGPRLGLFAGLMTVANLGMFVYGRTVTPELVLVLWLVLAWTGFALAYVGDRRRGLAIFYAALGLAMLTKGLLSPLGPLLVAAAFFWLTRERPLGPWVPWWGVLLAVAIALPWYLMMEARSPGFLWYTLVDNYLHNFSRQRVFPDEDVPLGSLEFLIVTCLAFLPWVLALPWALARALRSRWEDATARLWLLLGLWTLAVLGFFFAASFRLPHGALMAFPSMALLVARAWDEAMEGAPAAPSPRALLLPVLVLFALVTAGFAAGWMGVLPLSSDFLSSLDTATRNLTARGQPAPPAPLEAWASTCRSGAAIFALATLAMAAAAWRRSVALGVGVALATTIAFLPTVAADGMAQFARIRSVRPLTAALAQRVRPGDLVVHEGAIENSASVLLTVSDPLRVVNGLQSNLAFGATFPEARGTFWDSPQLEEAWSKPGRHFLISAVNPARSVVRALPAASVHLIAHAGGRWLYSNLAEGGRDVR